jgi:hypothetical protein
MLDWGHRLVLRSVARDGSAAPSPALDNLIAAGLVRPTDNGHEITDAGKAALAAGKATRIERIALPVGAVCLVIVAISSLLELLS